MLAIIVLCLFSLLEANKGHEYRKILNGAAIDDCAAQGCLMITTQEECNDASSHLGLPPLGGVVNGNRIPGCFYWTGGSVAFNTNLNDPSHNTNDDLEPICRCPLYRKVTNGAAIDDCAAEGCKMIESRIHCDTALSYLGLPAVSEVVSGGQTPGCTYTVGSSLFNTVLDDSSQIQNQAKEPICYCPPPKYIKVKNSGAIDDCAPEGCKMITTENDCNEATKELSLPSVSQVHHGGITPGCTYRTNEGVVVFNSKLDDFSSNLNPGLEPICRCPQPNSYCSRFPVEIADLSGDLSSCNSCQFRDCILECDCGRGKTSINIKDKCTDTTITVKGGALVCKERQSLDSTASTQKTMYVTVTTGICPDYYSPLTDLDECKNTLPGMKISNRVVTSFSRQGCRSWWTPAGTCFVYTNNKLHYTAKTCEVTNPSYHNHQLVCKLAADAYKEVGDVGEMLSIQGQCNSHEIGDGNCRQKSEAVFKAPEPSDSSDFNGLLWSFGQFVDHDLDLVEEVKTQIVHIPYGANNKQFEFHRARSDCPNGQFGNRRNSITARIDLSQVYGSTKQQEDNLRDPNDRTKMKMGSDDVLPSDDKTIFLCGDARCGENPFLTSQHTLWVKHHNVIVDELSGGSLSGDDLYEAAKQMNIATYQRIVDREFVPALVGPTPAAKYWRSGDWISHVHDKAKISIGSLYLNENEGGVTLDLCREMVFGLHACKKQYLSHGSNGECVCATVEGSTFLPSTYQWKTYEINKDVICPSQGDMSISSLFSNAAYRLHHLVNDEFVIDGVTENLKDGHFLSTKSYAEHGKLNAWFKRLLDQKSHKFGNHMAKSLQHALFSGPDKACDEKSKDNCRDLAALNCLRGIDVGLPTYNEVREMFGLPQREDFEWSENACENTLMELYEGDIDKVELFMGGSCEEPVSGAVLGETFLVIVKDQFLRLRDNDPNWIAYKAPADWTYSEVIKRCTGLDTSLFHGQASFLHRDTPGFVTPQKPTQGEFMLKIEGLQGEKENFINKRILDQDTLKISEM